jgi:hypothetical protein
MTVGCMAKLLVAQAEYVEAQRTQTRAVEWSGNAPCVLALQTLLKRKFVPTDLSAAELRLGCHSMMHLCADPTAPMRAVLAKVSPDAAARWAEKQLPPPSDSTSLANSAIRIAGESALCCKSYGSRPASGWQALADARGADGAEAESPEQLKRACAKFLEEHAADPPVWLHVLFFTECSRRWDSTLRQYSRMFQRMDSGFDSFAWAIIAIALRCDIRVVSPAPSVAWIDTRDLLSQTKIKEAFKNEPERLTAPGRRVIIAHVAFAAPASCRSPNHFVALVPLVRRFARLGSQCISHPCTLALTGRGGGA